MTSNSDIVDIIHPIVYIENDINSRWKQHKNICKYSLGTCLYNAYKKYGTENFNFKILCICFDIDTNRFEIDYIKKYNTIYPNGYNLATGGKCGLHNQHTKDKISRQRTGMKFSDSHRENIRKARLGTTIPEEQRKKMSESHKGYRHKEETKEKKRKKKIEKREKLCPVSPSAPGTTCHMRA